jgi:hypothetical protein
MSRSLILFLGLLGAGVFFASTAAVDLGVQELRLAHAGPRRSFAAGEVTPGLHGWVQLFGCVRHDLAVAVAAGGRVYRLGTPGAGDEDPVFTPLADADDCDEARPPRRLYALIEDDEALGTTLDRVYANHVTPPPVRAFVDGVAGTRALIRARPARAAIAFWSTTLDVHDLPLIAKGKRPGIVWVAALTVAAGVHGYLLLFAVALWLRRRHRHAKARAHFTDEENAFLSDPLDLP